MANLGDSRAVLGTMTENGIAAVQLTTDLKPSLPSKKRKRTRNFQFFLQGKLIYSVVVICERRYELNCC